MNKFWNLWKENISSLYGWIIKNRHKILAQSNGKPWIWLILELMLTINISYNIYVTPVAHYITSLQGILWWLSSFLANTILLKQNKCLKTLKYLFKIICTSNMYTNKSDSFIFSVFKFRCQTPFCLYQPNVSFVSI